MNKLLKFIFLPFKNTTPSWVDAAAAAADQPHFPMSLPPDCHLVCLQPCSDSYMPPLSGRGDARRKERLSADSFERGEAERGEESAWLSEKRGEGVAALKLNMQRRCIQTNLQAAEVHVARRSEDVTNWHRTSPELLSHLLHLPLLKLSKQWWLWHCVVCSSFLQEELAGAATAHCLLFNLPCCVIWDVKM